VDAAAFTLAAGGVSDPIVTDTGAVIVKVLEKQEVKPEELAKGRQGLRTELLNERRNRFYAAYMAKAREKMKIEINSQVLAQIVA
jgi:parvulin-like peptidyl-prolyl isomerase